MQDTNLEFNDAELNAMQDTSFFDLKWTVLEKINTLLAELQHGLESKKAFFDYLLPDGIFDTSGKISRGENYLGYPYLVMDYPRIFEKENIFAFRNMFWWGKHFSYTLHVGGIYFEQSKNNFVENFDLLKNKNVFICINDDPWEYHFEENNYTSADLFDASAFIKNRPYEQNFIKLSLRSDLSQWQHVKTNGINAFELFTKVLF